MKVGIYNNSGIVVDSVDFSELLSPNQVTEANLVDLYNRWRRHNRQPHSTSPRAGRDGVASTPRKGAGMSRIRRNRQGRATIASGTVGGKSVNAPVIRDYTMKINRKENLLALRTAILGLFDTERIRAFENVSTVKEAPIIFKDTLTSVIKFSELYNILSGVLFYMDFSRIGKKFKNGAMVWRKQRILLVTHDLKFNRRFIKNPYFRIVHSSDLSFRDIALNGQPNRLAIFTEQGIYDILNRVRSGYMKQKIIERL